RILSETRANLPQQYIALLETEAVTLEFSDDAIDAIARIAVDVNSTVENIGARRLQTVMEKLLEDISFDAEDRKGDVILIDADYVRKQLSGIAKDTDLSKYVL
ncbi:MAG: HslU--HslV peptidase ATPase subunit, partial [Sphingomonadaceae bacterium]|nr:HslU--HslV peptidase ATPase subunit [Sphingomonadaceae bacterium]